MKTLKISQIQFESKPTPQENCNQLENFYKKLLNLNLILYVHQNAQILTQ